MEYSSENCPCKKKSCIRYGDCKACMEFHHTHRKEKRRLTKCERKQVKAQKKGFFERIFRN